MDDDHEDVHCIVTAFEEQEDEQVFASASLDRMVHLFKHSTSAALEVELAHVGEEGLRAIRSSDVGAWSQTEPWGPVLLLLCISIENGQQSLDRKHQEFIPCV